MGFVWGAGQMVGAGIDDLITGRQRTTGDYLSIWAQNTIGGAQLGASVDVGLMSGGLALPASGALGAAGFDALTFGGEAQERSDFGKSQAKEAAVGAVLGPVLSKLAPAAGALVGRVPGAKRLGRWAAGKATEGVEAVARRYVRTEADDVLRKPFAQFVESATQLPGRARQALARRATQAREAIGQKLDDFTVRQEAAVQRVIANGRQSELGAVSFGAPGAPAVGRPVSRAPRINLSPMREVGRLPVMDPSVVKAALGRRSAASTDWAYQIHDHHLYPKWLGGRESGPVARIRGFEHLSDLEPQLVGFMKTRIPGLTKNSPRQIRRALRSGVTQDDITNALVDFELVLPEVWIDEVAFTRTCEACGSKRVRVDYSTVVKRVPHEADVLDVNGQCVVFSRRAREAALDASVSGAEYAPFDADGRYFYVRPRLDLGMPIIKPEEVLERRSDCPTCGAPLFRAFFGPLRFQAHRWNGEDLVRTSAVDETLFSQRAFEFLRGLNSGVERDRPVLLE